VIANLDELRDAHPFEDVWVIGGATVYAGTIGQADELLLTQVKGDFDCTKFFPPYEEAFALESRSHAHQESGVSYPIRDLALRRPERMTLHEISG
jgi:dihydrofolate reductase